MGQKVVNGSGSNGAGHPLGGQPLIPIPATAPPPQPLPTLHPTVFPTKSIDETPANLASADCGIVCTGEDHCEYAIKDGVSKSSSLVVPHCEWFCSQLAEAVFIPAPQHRVIEMLDGSFVFGSRWLGGTISPSSAMPWEMMVQAGIIPLSDIRKALSHIFAFDQFVCNKDRHSGNYLVYLQHTKHAMQAFDYSRAWLVHGWPLPPVPLLPFCNTLLQRHLFLSYWGQEYIEVAEVEVTLQHLRTLSKSRIRTIIEQHPEDWLQEPQRSAILDWWSSPEMMTRLDAISAGVKSGSYL